MSPHHMVANDQEQHAGNEHQEREQYGQGFFPKAPCLPASFGLLLIIHACLAHCIHVILVAVCIGIMVCRLLPLLRGIPVGGACSSCVAWLCRNSADNLAGCASEKGKFCWLVKFRDVCRVKFLSLWDGLCWHDVDIAAIGDFEVTWDLFQGGPATHAMKGRVIHQGM